MPKSIFTGEHRDDLMGIITTRDYFAAKAMQGMLAHSCEQAPNLINQKASELAQRAYEAADAMLEARNTI